MESGLANLKIDNVSYSYDLRAPFTSDRILEVRQGKMKPMPNLSVEVLSGIDKFLCDGSVWVGKGGIEGDEHDYTFHGGPDKAVHGCKNHPLVRWILRYQQNFR